MTEKETGREIDVSRAPMPPVGGNSVIAFLPADFPSTYRYAELIAASGMAPKSLGNRPEAIATAIFMGAEVGMSPMAALRSIAVINGRPSIWGDGALGLIRSKGLLDDIEEWFEGSDSTNDEFTAHCKVKRKGIDRVVEATFSVADARGANLYNKEGPWQNYRKRMLQMRARAFALRDLFTDVLGGFAIAEEIGDEDMRDVTPRNEPPSPGGEDDGKHVDNSGPSAGEQAERRPRGRPRKTPEPAAATSKVIEGEKVAENERAPVKEPERAAEPASKKEPAPKVEKNQEDPARTSGKTPGQEIAAIIPNLSKISDALRNVMKDLHIAMYAGNDTASLKEIYAPFFQKWRPSEDPAMKVEEDLAFSAVRNFHKDRIMKVADDDQGSPPDPDAGSAPPSPDDSGEPEFNFEEFRKSLVEELQSCETEDDVMPAFNDFVEMPRREKLISEDQYKALRLEVAMARMNDLSS